MSASGTIACGPVQQLLAALARLRPESAGINARAGISRAALDDPSEMLPLAAFTSMLEAAAHESGNRTLGLELGRDFKLAALGPISDLMQTAQTVGDALESFNGFFASVQTSTRTTLSVSDGTARLSYAIEDPAIRFREQDAGFSLAIEYSMLAGFLGPAWRASGVEFEHAVGDDLPFYQQHFDCPLRFGRRDNALLFQARCLDVPLQQADRNRHARLRADLAEAIQRRATRLDLVGGIEAWIAASLCRSVATDIEVVACDFGMSTRSFQRKLADHGVNYLDIRNRVRSHIAKCMLAETRAPVTSIALQLGYSETSAFSRGFKSQVGETPVEFRRRRRGMEAVVAAVA
ncbi:AraC-like transcriptional regulator QhpR [Rhodopseudomonas sp. NSM]|uniref:AraC-like transcriptional regulator QhpR n=1 Tax=Rhodopseudomonas sp. NSM TaxID=3457630 RepID=UPI0040365E73